MVFSDSLRHGSTRYSPISRNAGESEDDALDDNTAELKKMIGSLGIGRKSVKNCVDTLVDEGFESIQSLEKVKVEFLVQTIGLKLGHAHSIVQELPKWLPQIVRLRFENGPTKVLKEKPNCSLQLFRNSISSKYPGHSFVFVSRTAEIDEEQESDLSILDIRDSETSTIDIRFLNGKFTGKGTLYSKLHAVTTMYLVCFL